MGLSVDSGESFAPNEMKTRGPALVARCYDATEAVRRASRARLGAYASSHLPLRFPVTAGSRLGKARQLLDSARYARRVSQRSTAVLLVLAPSGLPEWPFLQAS